MPKSKKSKIENVAERPLRERQSKIPNLLLLAGGVGGAKLADGLAQILPSEKLTVIVNTGDDFTHLGLTICPDLDTVMYTLGGLANPETGWGRIDESWRTIGEVGRLGGPEWFRLGDLDLGLHLTRSHLLAGGHTLTETTRKLCSGFGIEPAILPMSNKAAPTFIDTEEGRLPFQTWFVEQRWQPAVRQVCLPEDVQATPQVLAALEKADVVVIAPSNPFVSIDPILNVYPIEAMITDMSELVVAISPIVGGQAVKGPAAKMMTELGMEVSAAAVADYYGEILDVFLFDEGDSAPLNQPGLVEYKTDILMRDRADRRRLASEILTFSMEQLAT